MRKIILLLFLVTITSPYDDIYCYECINAYDIGEPLEYQIKTYGPEDEINEVSFSTEETNRFINKIDSIINYSPYVYQNDQVIDF